MRTAGASPRRMCDCNGFSAKIPTCLRLTTFRDHNVPQDVFTTVSPGDHHAKQSNNNGRKSTSRFCKQKPFNFSLFQMYSPTTRANLDQDTFLVTHPIVAAATGTKEVMFIVRSSTKEGIIACSVKPGAATTSESTAITGDFQSMTFGEAAAAVKVCCGYLDFHSKKMINCVSISGGKAVICASHGPMVAHVRSY